MKKKLIFLFLFVTVSIRISFGQEAEQIDDLTGTIEKIFDLAAEKKFQQITSFIAYTGDNTERKYKSTLSAKNKQELNSAERIAKKIKAYLDISDDYEISGRRTMTEQKVEMTVLTVLFKSGAQELDIEFKFIKHNNKYLLADID